MMSSDSGAQLAALVQQLPERAAGHVLHREVEVPAVRSLVVHGDDVRVRQLGHRPGLADEPGDEVLVGGQLSMHDLDRDGAVEPCVDAQVYRRHAAMRDTRRHAVAAVE